MDNFVVSARKYRPATFESVVGQGHITATLKNAISRGQLAHAYLLCGPRGVGKTTCARIFAKAINCLSPVDSEACGQCESCRSFNEGRSFNIHELDAASNNSVDDIRSLTEQVRIPPQIGRYSVYIIDEVHMLSASAFNAFLKTLEEPPAHAVFILATTEKHKIIPTILSRCQIYDFNRIRVEDGVNYLKYIAGMEGVTFDDESLHLIAQKADGGMRDALSMFDKAVSFCGNSLCFKEVARTLNVLDYDTYFKITSLILSGDYPSVLTSFDEVLRAGFTPQTLAGGLNAHFRDLLMGKNQQTAGLLEVTGELLDRYKKQGAECDVGFLFEAIAVLTSVDGTLRTATNQRLNVELGLMKLCGLGQKKNERSVNTAAGSKTESEDGNLSSEFAGCAGSGGDVPLPELKKGSAPAVQNHTSPVARNTISQTVKAQAVTHGKKEEAEGNVNVPIEPDIAGAEHSGHDNNAPISPHPGNEVPDGNATGQKVGGRVGITSENAGKIADYSHEPAKPKKINGKIPHAISGASISSLLNTPKNIHDVDVDGDDALAGDVRTDPASQAKINVVKESFLAKIDGRWPRIAVALAGMVVSGNKISVTVPTPALSEEIMRNRSDILYMLAEMAGVNGMLELSVQVEEKAGPRRPIKAEDRARFLTEQNPVIDLLKKKLDLDLE